AAVPPRLLGSARPLLLFVAPLLAGGCPRAAEIGIESLAVVWCARLHGRGTVARRHTPSAHNVHSVAIPIATTSGTRFVRAATTSTIIELTACSSRSRRRRWHRRPWRARSSRRAASPLPQSQPRRRPPPPYASGGRATWLSASRRGTAAPRSPTTSSRRRSV